MPETISESSLPARTKKSQTLVYFAAFIALGLFTSALGPTLLGLAENTNSRISEISFIFLARSFGYLLGSLYSGRAFDRVPGHVILAVVLAFGAGMAALTPVVSLLSVLTLVLFMLGVAESALDVGTNLLLVWVHRKNSDPYLNALHFFFGVGAFLMPLLVARSILYTGDINWAYWVITIYSLPIVIWLLRVPSPKPIDTTEQQQYHQNDFLMVALIAVLFFLYVGAEASFGGWIYTYTTTLGLGSLASAAYLTSAFWGALTFGRLLAIPVALRVRPRIVLLIDLIGCLLSLSLIIVFNQSYVAIWVGTLGLGLSMASFFPTTLAYAARRMETRGSITRWFFVGAAIGGMVLPWVIGQLFEPLGPQVAMFVIVGDLALALMVFLLSIPLGKISQSKLVKA